MIIKGIHSQLKISYHQMLGPNYLDLKKIFHAYIKSRRNDDEEEKNSPRMQYLKLTDVIIDAIPKNVIIYNIPVGDKKT